MNWFMMSRCNSLTHPSQEEGLSNIRTDDNAMGDVDQHASFRNCITIWIHQRNIIFRKDVQTTPSRSNHHHPAGNPTLNTKLRDDITNERIFRASMRDAEDVLTCTDRRITSSFAMHYPDQSRCNGCNIYSRGWMPCVKA